MARKTFFHDRMLALILMVMVALDTVQALKGEGIGYAVAAGVFLLLLISQLKRMHQRYHTKHHPGITRMEVQSAKYGNTFTNVQCYHNGPIEPF